MQTFDVVVIGAGIVGAAFALGLERTGLSVALVEPHPPASVPERDDWDNRVYTVSPGNVEWLERLGVWQRLPEHRLTRVERMLIYGEPGPAALTFSAYDAGLRELAWTAESRELQAALWSALEEAGHVTLHPRTRPRDISWDREHARLLLEDGAELTGRLIVAADGADSWVRERAGIQATTREYRQVGVVANFECQAPHEGAAFQWFLPEGVLALLPLAGNCVSMVWSAQDAWARELLEASPERLSEEVARAGGGILGRLRPLGRAAGFPLKLQHVPRLVEPRVALIGDAAHNIHPLAGQGVNLGLRDARELAEVLTARGAQRDCGDYRLLRQYERARKEDIAALELTTDGLEKLFSVPGVWIARLRNLGLAFVDAQPPLKNGLTRRAAA
jgi:ubiquinone biosynthesis UbiH/UbiF/VisC/COQ6 family hydroxylase